MRNQRAHKLKNLYQTTSKKNEQKPVKIPEVRKGYAFCEITYYYEKGVIYERSLNF